MKFLKIKMLFMVAVFSIFTVLSFGQNYSEAATAVSQNQSKDNTVTIYVVRHGQTIFNTYQKTQGWSDTPLTDKGVQGAKYLGEGLKGINFDAYYTSDAGRQRQTMKTILAQKGVTDYKINELTGLREMFFGGFEGNPESDEMNCVIRLTGYKTAADYAKAYAAGKVTVKQRMDTIAQSDPLKQAEDYQQVVDRMHGALDIIVANAHKNNQHNILVVTSGLAITAMINDMTDNPVKRKSLDNVSVTKIINKDGKYTVTEIGNMDYANKGKVALMGK